MIHGGRRLYQYNEDDFLLKRFDPKHAFFKLQLFTSKQVTVY